MQADLWLVRTSKNVLSGPYSLDQLRGMITERKLAVDDEVCRANHYWIALHESQEVWQQLGVRVPRTVLGSSDDDPTDGDGLLQDTKTKLIEAPGASHGPGTTVAMRTATNASATGHRRTDDQYRATVVGGTLEKPSLIRGFAYILGMLALAILWAVFKKLQA